MHHQPLPILHADAELVAIDKPAGLLVHPSGLDAHAEATAQELLRDQLGQWLHPLHRLDKGTSGVLLFARTPEAARRYGAAFEQGRVHKAYLCVVRGWPPDAGEIAYPLARDPERPSRGQERLAALTRYTCLARGQWPFAADARHALVRAEPATGRRHQIRRHFKHIAHPLVGDANYGKGALNRAAAAHLGVARLWLHALSVALPGGLRIEAPPGPEWALVGWPCACAPTRGDELMPISN